MIAFKISLGGFALTAFLLVACSGGDGQTGIPSKGESPSTGEAAKGGTTTTADPKKTDPSGKTNSTATPTTPTQTPTKPGDPTAPANPAPNGDGTNTGGVDGQNGGVGRVSVNEHCCFDGKYFKCPDANACFGGFDIDACLGDNCAPGDACWDTCFDKLANAGAPKGCDANAPPPNGVDCANGNINIGN